MVVELSICSIIEKFFRIHLKHMKRFYDVQLLSLCAKSTLKIVYLGGYVLSIVFFLKLLNNNGKKMILKNIQ